MKGLCCLSISGQQQLGERGLAYRDLKRMAKALGDEPWGLRVWGLFEGSPIFDDLNIAAHCNVPAMKRLRKHNPAAILSDLDFLLSHLRIMVQTFESLREAPVIFVDNDAALRRIERFHREGNFGKILQMAHFYGRDARSAHKRSM